MEPVTPQASPAPTTDRSDSSDSRSRGQVLVIFAFLLTILVGFSAMVIDISWIWANELRVQRAADAAALAGVVHLPGQVNQARGDAFDEARKNGYRNGFGGVVVIPSQDAGNPRRMVVSISAPVDTFFMGLFGFDQLTVSRQAKADFVLPVPMGSPLNYYGVGDFRSVVAGTPTNTGHRAPTGTTAPNGWTTPNGALVDGGSTHANNATGAQQGYGNFGYSIPAGSTISGIEVRVDARSTDGTGCAIGVALSWNNGGTWTTQKTQSLTASFATSFLGNATDTWGRTWSATEFANGSFAVRVADVDPGSACTDSARTDLDFLTVIVHYTGPATTQGRQVLAPDNTPLCAAANCSQGFWGAIEGQGSNRSTGDAYATGYNPNPTLNADYEPEGYDYSIELPSGGSVHIYDPTFCATSDGPGGGHFGTGDHWLGAATPVSTYFRLWNTNGTPIRGDDTLVTSSGSLFVNEYQADLITGSNFSDGGEPTNPTNCGEGVITNNRCGGLLPQSLVADGEQPRRGRLSAPGDDHRSRGCRRQLGRDVREHVVHLRRGWNRSANLRLGPDGLVREHRGGSAERSTSPRSIGSRAPARRSRSGCSTPATWARRRGCSFSARTATRTTR